MEENEEDAKKLMKNYSKKYNAMHIGGTTMAIIDDAGDDLVDKYLPAV